MGKDKDAIMSALLLPAVVFNVMLLVTDLFADSTVYEVGAARMDITPDQSIRLAGYFARRQESDGIAQRLWAKAIAIGNHKSNSAILITVENCCVPASITEEVASRIENRAGLPRRRITICSTHTHTGPCLKGALPIMFGEPIPEDHQARIDSYTKKLTDNLERVAMAALADSWPGKLAWNQGTVRFACNRRMIKDGKHIGFGKISSGPVDHALPMLCITDHRDKLRFIIANYACHCTSLGGDFNKICGDWAGYAQEYIENKHSDVIALITIGCGADADPQPRTGLEYAKQHGREVASEVNRLLKGKLKPITGQLVCRFERIKLPFDNIPPRKQWEERSKHDDAIGYHARMQLEKLDRGEALPTELSYPIQTWVFGRDLAMVFLAGEVVVDYSLKLKRMFDADRLWVTAYANDVPCYIPSKRILAEGGYEAEHSMIFYDRPTRLAPVVEDNILKTVHHLLPDSFQSNRSSTPQIK
ncbi:MAG: neutral/alkaline non-lysosomal ceramidase N-terminal domain-containing protein [Planctomycetota bacterium]|nr:MAG: neutral/alkaline non-lysosomal ceramidase N-terminal domain-containing protein [Planctomycetota bacterium]